MSDIKQIQDFIQTTKMSKDEVFNLIMTLQNKEVSLDKSSQKTYALAVEEEDFLNKCSKNRGINPDTKKVVCPHCGSTNTVGNGSKKGRNRYLCRDCHKSFGDTILLSSSSNRLIHYLQKIHMRFCCIPSILTIQITARYF